jgi:hypothetical protein
MGMEAREGSERGNRKVKGVEKLGDESEYGRKKGKLET